MAIEYRYIKDIDKAELQDLFLSNKWDSGNYPDKLKTASKVHTRSLPPGMAINLQALRTPCLMEL
jgi:hypothetical protein